MIEVLVISENNTAEEMIKTVRKVLGKKSIKNVHSLRIRSRCSREQVCRLIEEKVREFEDDIGGILLLTELYGSTQTNLCMDIVDRDDVQMVSGYNLPMLIKAATLNQSLSLDQLTAELEDVGRKYIQTYKKKVKV